MKLRLAMKISVAHTTLTTRGRRYKDHTLWAARIRVKRHIGIDPCQLATSECHCELKMVAAR